MQFDLSETYTMLANCVTELVLVSTLLDIDIKQNQGITWGRNRLLDLLALRNVASACMNHSICAGTIAILNLSSTFLGDMDLLHNRNWLLADAIWEIIESAVFSRIMILIEITKYTPTHDSIERVHKLKQLDLAFHTLSRKYVIGGFETNFEISYLEQEAMPKPSPRDVVYVLSKPSAGRCNSSDIDKKSWPRVAPHFLAMFCMYLGISVLEWPVLLCHDVLLGSLSHRCMTGTFIHAHVQHAANCTSSGASRRRLGGSFAPMLQHSALTKARLFLYTQQCPAYSHVLLRTKEAGI